MPVQSHPLSLRAVLWLSTWCQLSPAFPHHALRLSTVTFCSHSPCARRSGSCCWQSGRHSLHFLRQDPDGWKEVCVVKLWHLSKKSPCQALVRCWGKLWHNGNWNVFGGQISAGVSEGGVSLWIIFRLPCWLISYHTHPPLQRHEEGYPLFSYPHSANKNSRTLLLPSPFFSDTSHSLRLAPLTLHPYSPSSFLLNASLSHCRAHFDACFVFAFVKWIPVLYWMWGKGTRAGHWASHTLTRLLSIPKQYCMCHRWAVSATGNSRGPNL